MVDTRTRHLTAEDMTLIYHRYGELAAANATAKGYRRMELGLRAATLAAAFLLRERSDKATTIAVVAGAALIVASGAISRMEENRAAHIQSGIDHMHNGYVTSSPSLSLVPDYIEPS